MSLYYFWRLQRRIYFHAFSSFQRLPVFLGSPSSIFKDSNTELSPHTAIYLPSSSASFFCLPLLLIRTLGITQSRIFTPSQGHWINNLNSALPYNLRYLRILGIKSWTSLGEPLPCLPHTVNSKKLFRNIMTMPHSAADKVTTLLEFPCTSCPGICYCVKREHAHHEWGVNCRRSTGFSLNTVLNQRIYQVFLHWNSF